MGATTGAAPRESRPDAPLHLVFVPFLSRSHFAPVAAAAAAASCGGDGATTTATILTTPHFAALAPASVPVHAVPFRFPGGHEDFSLLPDDEAGSAPAFFAAVEESLAPALAAAVRARARDGAVAVVSDAILHWAPRVARACGVPHVTFQTIGAFAAASMVAAHLPRAGASPDPFAGFPRHAKLRGVLFDEVALAHLPLFRAAEAESHAVVFNSFAALEADFAEFYRRHLAGSPKKVFLVGPRRAITGGGVERDPILRWLDGQAAGSVVYACFGSTCRLGAAQLRELAAGLRASGPPFVWAIPAPAEGAEHHGGEESASGHGMVVAGRWVPQAEILAHRAVGGFLSHCGWNSVLDAAWAGVPLATWPLRAEQFLNEAFVVDVLRAGVRVRAVADKADWEAMVPAEAVSSAVGRLMAGDEDAAARRARASDLGVAARAAVAEGGSSCSDWARMVRELKACAGSRSTHDNGAAIN